MSNAKAVLCFVHAPWAYFTTQPIADQWGDDWDDAPYEHNAGEPYTWMAGFDGGNAPWEITKVAFTGAFDQPRDGYHNSPFSVQQINKGGIAWLRSSWHGGKGDVIILAGVSLERFTALIQIGGGDVYLPVQSTLSTDKP